MSERHGGELRLVSFPVSASYIRSEESARDRHNGLEWRESRNGLPPSRPYARSGRDAEREREVAAMVAAAKAEAARRTAGADGEVTA